MTVVRVRGYALPHGEYVDLYADCDRWTTDPVRGAELIAEGWLVPGLVDAHTHPGAAKPGDPLDNQVLRDQLHQHVDAGVTLIRAPGMPGEPPSWFGTDPDLPRPGTPVPGWPSTASSSTAGRKIVADWAVDDEVVPLEVLTAVVAAVHEVGGRVAVHTQHAAGGAAAVAAGVDSVEHGMCLDPELLTRMAEQGTVLTPTLSVIQAGLRDAHERPDSLGKQWYVSAAQAHPHLVATAAEAGVRILAGTDSVPHGRISDEVRALAAAGMRPHDALAAASWRAREYLGLPGLEPGAPADAVIYAEDPRLDLNRLADPTAVILRGSCVRGPR